MPHFKLELFDILIIVLRSKKLLLSTFFISLITTYLFIYFFVGKQYETSATIIPSSGQSSLAGMSSLVKNISNVLPIGLGDVSQESEMDLYNTIIYSRTSIENLMDKFDLQKLYKIKSRENSIKLIKKTIKTDITMENAFVISVRSITPELASDMTNYMVEYLNSRIIELNVSKSKDNRVFLEKRYQDINTSLQNSEDSLKKYQETVGMLDADNQIRYSIEAFAKLESDMVSKQVEYNIASKIYGKSNPAVNTAKIAFYEYKNKLEKLKSGKDKSSVVIGIDHLPQQALDYYRYYRDVKINESMLEIIIPLFEQSKIEEQKNIPIIQIIDSAIPPERKVFPSRIKTAGIVSIATTSFIVVFLIFSELLSKSNNAKILLLKKTLFNI